MKHRLIATLLAAGTMVVMAFPLAVAARADADNATATIHAGSEQCPTRHVPFPEIGSVNFHHHGDTWAINYHLKDAKPDTGYYVQLRTQPGCAIVANFGTVVTDDHGNANADFEAIAPGVTSVWAAAWDGSHWNDTFTVTLN